MNKRVVMKEGGFRIESEYDPDLVAALKAVVGRRWDAARRFWTVPLAKAAPLMAIALRYGSTQSGSVLGEVLSAYRAQTARPVRRRGIVLAKAA